MKGRPRHHLNPTLPTYVIRETWLLKPLTAFDIHLICRKIPCFLSLFLDIPPLNPLHFCWTVHVSLHLTRPFCVHPSSSRGCFNLELSSLYFCKAHTTHIKFFFNNSEFFLKHLYSSQSSLSLYLYDFIQLCC